MRSLKWHNSLYTKLIAIILVIMLVTLLFTTLYLRYSKQALEKEIWENTSANISYLLSDTETQINHLQSQMIELLTGDNSETRSFLAIGHEINKADYWMKIQAIIRELQQITYTNPLVGEVQLCYPAAGLSLSSRIGIHLDLLPGLKSALYAYASEQPLMLLDGMLYVGCVYPSYVRPDEEPRIFIRATIPDEKLANVLCSLTEYSTYETAFVSLNTGKVLTGKNTMHSEESILKMLSDTVENSGLSGNHSAGLLQQSKILSGTGNRAIMCSYDADTSCCIVYSESLNAGICVFIPLNEIYAVPNRLQFILIVFILISVILFILLTFSILNWLKNPFDRMLKACDAVANGRYELIVPSRSTPDEFQELMLHFNTMTEKQKELVNTVLRQQIYARESELKQLQAQINPHFLYNSFFMLRHMVSNDEKENAEILADYLGNYFSYITDYTQTDATLEEEFRHAVNYLSIQKMRFDKRLNIEIDALPEDALHWLVPRLILQPLLENSVVHGIHSIRKNAFIRLSIQSYSNGLCLTVEDNGNELTDQKIIELNNAFTEDVPDGAASGLINIHRRLKLRFSETAGLHADRSELGGMKIIMTLPSPTRTLKGGKNEHEPD